MPSTASLSFLQLHRDALGRLVMQLPQGASHVGVLPVRAFPIAAPEDGLSFMGADGHELLWVERMADLPEPVQHLVKEELAVREFVPTITKILEVSSFSTPCTWQIETDRGPTRFVLKAEEDIRRLHGRTSLLIASGEGVQYAIPDSTALDKVSRRILERFL